MTLQSLQCFLTVARTLNYTKAAEQLYISQPVVSRHILQLEKELGFQLLDRNVRRAVKLTGAGQTFYDTLSRCELDYTQTVQRLKLEASVEQIIFCLPEDCLPPLALHEKFDQFTFAHPQNQPAYKYISYSDIGEEIAGGNLVICQTSAMRSPRKYNTLPITLQDIPFYLITSAGHPALQGFSAQGTPSTAVADLTVFADSPLFLPKTMPPSLISFYRNLVRNVCKKDPELLLLDNTDAILLYLQSNRGLTIGTEWFKYRHSPQLAVLPLPYTTQYAIYWNPERPMNPDLKAFILSLEKTQLKSTREETNLL